jgi:hypothetical protein
MQSMQVSVGPVTAAVTNQVAASQTPYAGQVILNGLGSNFSINNIATAQDPAGAGNLTLVSSIVLLTQPSYVYVTSAANDSALSFTITGLDSNGRPLTETITGANAKARCTTNKFTAVSNVAVSGDAGSVQVGSFYGVTSFTGSTARQVTVISGGSDESGKTFVITGTGPNGEVQSETLTGPTAGATVTSTAYFKTVSSVTVSADTTGAITVGMTNTASSPWVRFDDYAPSNISIQANVTGSVTYSIQSTLDSPNDPQNPVLPTAVNWISSSDSNVVAATASKQSNFLFAPKFARVILTTTSTGSVRTVFLQSSNGPA